MSNGYFDLIYSTDLMLHKYSKKWSVNSPKLMLKWSFEILFTYFKSDKESYHNIFAKCIDLSIAYWEYSEDILTICQKETKTIIETKSLGVPPGPTLGAQAVWPLSPIHKEVRWSEMLLEGLEKSSWLPLRNTVRREVIHIFFRY